MMGGIYCSVQQGKSRFWSRSQVKSRWKPEDILSFLKDSHPSTAQRGNIVQGNRKQEFDSQKTVSLEDASIKLRTTTESESEAAERKPLLLLRTVLSASLCFFFFIRMKQLLPPTLWTKHRQSFGVISPQRCRVNNKMEITLHLCSSTSAESQHIREITAADRRDVNASQQWWDPRAKRLWEEEEEEL